MNRYQDIPIIKTADGKRVYATSRYPEAPLSPNDIYVYTTQGDRYDVLALSYYGDSSLWWVINRANPNQPNDSLYPIVGSQLRIPSFSRIASIITAYENLNELI